MQRQHKEAMESAAQNRRWIDLLLALLLCVATFIAYLPVRTADFVNYDDEQYVTRNWRVQEGLNWDNVRWAFTTTEHANWHPLTWLSYMLDCELFGADPLKPGAHHMMNVAIHALNSALLFCALLRMTRLRWRSALVATLFALHPLHVESVAWIAERKDLLSTLWGLLAILSYVRFVEQPGVGRYIAIVVCFGLSLLCKPMLVTLPFVLLLLDVWPLRRLNRFWILDFGAWIDRTSNPESKIQNPKSLLLALEKLPLLAMSAASCVMTVVAQRQAGAIGDTDVISLATRLTNAVRSYAMYIVQMIWPVEMAVLYPYPQSWPVWSVVGALGLVFAISVIVSVLSRKRPWLLIGWLWYLGTLLPVIGLVQVGEQSRADRYTYFPLIGLFIMVAWSFFGGGAASAVTEKKTRLVQIQAACVVIVLCVLGSLTWRQLAHWQNSRALFTHALAVTEKNATAHTNLAMALKDENDLEGAAAQFRAAIEFDFRYPEAHNGLGYIEALRENLDVAVKHYKDAIRFRPDFPEAHHALGWTLAKQKKFEEAIVHYREAVRINPELVNLHYDFGYALVSTGKTDEAIAQFQQAVKLKPDHADAYDQLGMALTNRNRVAEAIEAFRKVVALQPNDAAIHNNLARLLLIKPGLTGAEVLEAVKLAQRACQLDGGRDPRTLRTLAAAFATAGQIKMAIDAENEALQKAQAAGDQAMVDSIHASLAQYEAVRQKTK